MPDPEPRLAKRARTPAPRCCSRAARRACSKPPAPAGPRSRAAAAIEPRPAPPIGTIHLGAILYHAPADWRVWLNGQSFTPTARPGPIEILKVTADRVVLAWRRSPGSAPTRVELQPNQTYLTASGQVVEGRLEPSR